MNAAVNQEEANPDWLAIVAAHVASLRFGVVQIIVHEARVVQIEKTEKVRLERAVSRESDRNFAYQTIGGESQQQQQHGNLTEPSEEN